MCLDFCLRTLAYILADGMLKPKNELRKSQGLGSVPRWPHAADGMLKPKNELRKSQRLGSILRWPHAVDGMLIIIQE